MYITWGLKKKEVKLGTRSLGFKLYCFEEFYNLPQTSESRNKNWFLLYILNRLNKKFNLTTGWVANGVWNRTQVYSLRWWGQSRQTVSAQRNHPVNCRHKVSRTHAGIFCFGKRSMCELHAQCFRKLDCKMIIVALQLITRFRLMRKQLVRTSVSYHWSCKKSGNSNRGVLFPLLQSAVL